MPCYLDLTICLNFLLEGICCQASQKDLASFLQLSTGIGLEPVTVIAAKIVLLKPRALRPGIAEGAQGGLGPGQIGMHGFNLPPPASIPILSRNLSR